MKILLHRIIIFITAFIFPVFIYAQSADTAACCASNCDCTRPDGHAPVGVQTADIHEKGEWMISYSFMDMIMSGNRSGTSKITDDGVFQNYYASPETMGMQMNMFMVMYGISNKFNVMAMLNFINNSMSMNMDPTMQMHMGGTTMPMASMVSSAGGLGDSKIYALYKLTDKRNAHLVLGLGFNIPNGSIEKKSLNIDSVISKTSYCMQTGTGSFGILPSVAFTGQSYSFSWGISAKANIQTGANSEGYQFGNQYSGTSWIAYKLCKFLSASVRAEIENTGSIKGYDQDIAIFSANDPTANPANYGGTCATGFLGVNFYVPKGIYKNLRIALEYGIPFYENLNGVQMSVQSKLNAGISFTF